MANGGHPGRGYRNYLGHYALFAKPIVIDVDQLKQAIHVDGKPLPGRQISFT